MKQLKSYAEKRFHKLADSLESYRQVEDPEVLHLIRLELKKIKSILNLLQYGVRNFNGHKHYVPFRTIFRRAGEIRQPEVIYKLLLQYQVEGITDSQIPNTQQVERLTKEFRTEVPAFLEMVSTEKKKLTKHIRKLSKKEAKKYLIKKRKELSRLLFPHFKTATLHKTRKNIKEIIFLQWADTSRKTIAFFKKIEKVIGQWHDKQVLLPILRKGNHEDQASLLKAECKKELLSLQKTIRSFYGKGKV